MKWFHPAAAIIIPVLLSGCNQYRQKESASNVLADSTMQQSVSSVAAMDTGDGSRKFIRTAELKFKVIDAIKSTGSIEDIVQKQGGFVTYTHLGRTVDHIRSTAISKDSVKESTYFTLSNSMVLRVPNNRLDTTLKEIAANIDFLEYRIIKADDVALQFLSNELSRKRSAQEFIQAHKGIGC